MYVDYRYKIKPEIIAEFANKKPKFGFGLFGETTYYRTYSRRKEDGSQETWLDTCTRVVQGILSIHIDYLIKKNLYINHDFFEEMSYKLLDNIFNIRFFPPGRGLWAMGTEFVYEKGSLSLYNCGAVDVKKLSKDFNWAMDALMCGVGVGFGVFRESAYKLQMPSQKLTTFVIPDSREGWVDSIKVLLESYENGTDTIVFDYSLIRPEGALIKGFGGKSSGYKPLEQLHERVRLFCERYVRNECSWTRLCADIANSIGACVVAGNVRRSAELLLGHIDDPDFLTLKNYEDISCYMIYNNKEYICAEYHKSPDIITQEYIDKYWSPINNVYLGDPIEPNTFYDGRSAIGWMSNNSLSLEKKFDFKQIPVIADSIINTAEPGFLNLLNIQSYGRFGEFKKDKAYLANPCVEIPLEPYEVCNLAELFPTLCNKKELYEASKLATYYSTIVSILPTHREETNEVVNRNHRIGISMSGIADWFDQYGAANCTPMLRKAYKIVKETNKKLAIDLDIPPSIRLTCVKPSGSVSQLAGVSAGMHFPTFKYAIRRIRIAENSELVPLLIEANIPHEKDVFSQNTLVFEFPIDQGKTRPATSVSAWEQFALLATLQREWADNMVSCTIYFDPKTEANQLEHMLGQFAPVIKSVSLCPHTDKGAYPQMPYEGITKEEYKARVKSISVIDWDRFRGSDGMDQKFCTNDSCSI